MRTDTHDDNYSKIVSSAKYLIAFESMRRWVLAIGLFLCVILMTWTDFRPYYAVTELSKWDLQTLNRQDTLSNEAVSEDALVTQRAERTDKPQVSIVNGAEWEQWFASVNKALVDGEVMQSWRHRLAGDQLTGIKRFEKGKALAKPTIRRLVFGEKEEPLATLMARKHPGEEVILSLASGASKQHLMVYYSEAPYLVGLGGSLFGIPEAFSYPLRHYWYLVLAVVFLIYILLPWPQEAESVCAYKRWQVILGDFASCLLYGMFMAMPLLIVGSAISAVTTWVWFTAIFWAIAALGLCALWWSYFYASYRIHMLDDRLIFTCPQGVRSVKFEEMTSIESVRCVPPKWLIVLSFILALSGKGAGRALLLATSSAGGCCIGTKNGDAIYVWTTNPMGQSSLTNLDRLTSTLDSLKCTQSPHLREFEAIFPPVIERFFDRKTKRIIEQETEQRVKKNRNESRKHRKGSGGNHQGAHPIS